MRTTNTRRAKLNALSGLLSGDARALKVFHAPRYPRDPITGGMDYQRMTDEQLRGRIKEIYAQLTEAEQATHYPDGFRLPNLADLTDEQLKQRIAALRNIKPTHENEPTPR